ncbi:MAG: glycine cleavage system H-protein subunit [Bathelium mastoideum]|nr:MAG: glycine cleavage system H-protein subunit [Bathelium mastoideum]
MALSRTAARSIRNFRTSAGLLVHSRVSTHGYTVPRATSKASHPVSRRSFTSSRLLYEKKYTEDHEWIELSGDGETGTIGVSRYAADALGDVVYVELPTVGLEVGAGDTIGAVESVKSASDIMTPISGIVTEANSLLEQKPATINKAPEADGWIAKIQIENKEEMESLMSAEEYKKFTDEVKASDENEH